MKNKVIDLTGQKGTLGDRYLKGLAEAGDEVIIVKLFEGEELEGLVRGIGFYTILLQAAQGDILIFKHAIKTIWRTKPKGRWEKARERIEEKTASHGDDKGDKGKKTGKVKRDQGSEN